MIAVETYLRSGPGGLVRLDAAETDDPEAVDTACRTLVADALDAGRNLADVAIRVRWEDVGYRATEWRDALDYATTSEIV